MKKIIAFLLIFVLALGCFAACGAKPDDGKTTSPANPSASGGARLKIITTIFPEYDWVRNILGDLADEADVTMLLDTGVDLHNYQPTAEDIIRINEADLFLHVGGESDAWVEDVLAEATGNGPVELNLLALLGDRVKEEEVVEGMEAEEEEAQEGEEEGPEYDEHVWLSLKNAAFLCEKIADAIAAADPENEGTYRANAAAYIEKLNALDGAYAQAVAEAKVKTLLFGDRFPFRYLTDDYGLSYYAAFVGCSAETEASFETMAFLTEKVDSLGLTCVMAIEGPDHSIAETIARNAAADDIRILTMDSLQSTTAKDVADGKTYLGVMEKNLEVLKDALS